MPTYNFPVSAFFQIRKKVHWSDTDAAGVAPARGAVEMPWT